MKNQLELQARLGAAMKDVMEGKITVDQAKAIAQLGGVMVQVGKLEVELVKATQGAAQPTWMNVDSEAARVAQEKAERMRRLERS
ncbi:hypothetical protein [Pseudomonas aeruginosa]|uniref:hypothetical protein n=1 Tax=Pseudomonas aeruginosa TaxID=287 RepID=UPI001E36F712|nr:hypothetical protein [Pseudomonas aeruginosa]MCD2761359.1 hypothetical protein [Pseudomonas aeruginosa]HBP0991525.1 hypothetical protein [Pseudomonas aeruginosa]HBP1202120.1 hypothetical protein [Pseudomonas aeruginosa]